MKRILPIALLIGAAHFASAGTTNIYVENWGSPNAISAMTNVGWNGLAVSEPGFGGAGPYLGIYAAVGPTDSSTGNPLPANTVYFTGLGVSQTTPGMFYTTDASGPGPGGNSSFVDINPTQYTNLSLSVESLQQGGGASTNYFAVQVGGAWYVSATALPGSAGLGGQNYSNNVMAYTNLASAWLTLTTNATGVTIGSTPGANLSGDITGIGVVELPGGGGWNYNQLAITAFAPNPPPPTPPSITAQAINQTVYAGGGASFLIGAAGSKPLSYQWYTNTVALANGSKYSGVNTNMLTISNCSANDVVNYSITITNVAGTTNSANYSLTVNPVPAGLLYAETYPYVGLSGNLPLTGVGWANASGSGTTVGIFQSGTGLGEVFDYSGSATTNLNYTTASNDVGQSGLPFNPIDPTSVPAVTFQAAFSPGNGAGTVAGNVTVYWAVQLAGSNWYASTHAIPINISQQNNYLTNQLGYSTNTAASNWDTMTVNGGSVVIGGQAAGPLTGLITGAGMIFVHPNTSGASMNWANFAITTNAVSILAPQINTAIGLYSQSVATGGGASFSVALSAGTLPITYSWSLNGVMLTNGGRISGASSPTLTIGNTTLADTDASDGATGNVIAYVSNSVGTDNSATHFPVSLFVTNAPVGQLYIENFPYVGPSGNQPISMDGWSEAVPGTPNVVFEAQNLTGLGAAFAYLGSAGTTVYYTTTGTDTNQAGLPFPGINPAFYPDLAISASIAPTSAPTNVTAYVAVQFGSQWYAATNPLPVPTTASGTFTGYTVPFNGAAANWDLLTITGSGGLIGAQSVNNLTGVMTGAGLVFKTVNTGGTFNFNNLTITGSGLGGINYSPAVGGGINLSWVGNPAVNLQSTPGLSPSSWTDVPNTLGAYSYVVSPTAPQQYFRLVAH